MSQENDGSILSDTAKQMSDEKNNTDYINQENQVLAQQDAERAVRSKQLDKIRIALLRGRFSGAGAQSSAASLPVTNADGVSSASLYSRITGR